MSTVMACGVRRRLITRDEIRNKDYYDMMAKRGMVPLEISRKVTMWINESDTAPVYRQPDLFGES